MITNNMFIHKSPIPAGADAPAGQKNRLVKLAGTFLLVMMLGFGAVYVHKLPLVQEVKSSFTASGIDVSAFTYSDVKEYSEIISTLQANPVR